MGVFLVWLPISMKICFGRLSSRIFYGFVGNLLVSLSRASEG